MLTLNSVSFAGTTITGNFSVDMSDIDPGAGEDQYVIVVKRHSDSVTVHTALTGTVVNNGVGIFTGNTSTVYGVFGVYDITVVPTEGGDTVNATSNSLPLTIGATTMAGTAQGRLFKASVSMKEPNGKTFTLSGNGIDAAGAIGELQAKLAIIDSLVTVVSAVRISGNMSAGQITAFNTVNAARTTSGTGYDDADITLLQTFNAGTATQVRETPTLRVRDVRNDLADAGRDDGSVDLGAAEIVALATAYQDPDGNTGYVPYKGRFVLS